MEENNVPNENTNSAVSNNTPKKQGGIYDEKGQYIFKDGSYYDVYGIFHPSENGSANDTTYAFNWENINTASEQNSTSDAQTQNDESDFHPDSDVLENDIPLNEETPTPPDCKKKRSAFKVTMIVMACVFALALIVLICTLIFGMVDTVDGLKDTNTTVNIQVSDKGPTNPEEGLASSELLSNVCDSVVIVSTQKQDSSGFGSGFIISEDGYIVTNHHVIEDADIITVDLHDGSSYKAQVVGSSEKDDVAVLKINAKNLTTITLGQSKNCYLGERVYAIGCPDSYDYSWTVTSGTISCTERKVKITDSSGNYEKTMNLIQTDTAVNPGNSGGPLVNTRGEVIGIVTLKVTNSTGLGFAIPIDGSLELVKSIIENGNIDGVTSSVSVPRTMVGITCVGILADTYYAKTETGVKVISEEQSKLYSDYIYSDVSGVYVMGIDSKYNAVGVLSEGDVITGVNGGLVYNNEILSFRLNKCNVGDEIEIEIYRNGKTQTVSLVLAQEITE